MKFNASKVNKEVKQINSLVICKNKYLKVKILPKAHVKDLLS